MITYKKNKKSPKSLKQMIIGTVLLIGCGTGSLYFIDNYNNPGLYGKWISTETLEEIVFNKDGTVTLNDVPYIPQFQITAPNKMLYTVEDKEFDTYYALDGRSLYWGLSKEQVEVFKRK